MPFGMIGALTCKCNLLRLLVELVLKLAACQREARGSLLRTHEEIDETLGQKPKGLVKLLAGITSAERDLRYVVNLRPA